LFSVVVQEFNDKKGFFACWIPFDKLNFKQIFSNMLLQGRFVREARNQSKLRKRDDRAKIPPLLREDATLTEEDWVILENTEECKEPEIYVSSTKEEFSGLGERERTWISSPGPALVAVPKLQLTEEEKIKERPKRVSQRMIETPVSLPYNPM
jgi:hypothetical protein